ncbi:hypothetical protein CDL60_12260 [Roseateles noduli]|nr:hypothetical protein CDL60_12260 [Roseateles noduli]
MAIKSIDLMSLAEDHSLVDAEPSRRSAISRAYHASFHRCLDWECEVLKREKVKTRRGSVHQQLLKRLEKPASPCSPEQAQQARELHQLLSRQRDRRVAADYRLDDDVGDKLLRQQLRDANQLFRTCGD